MINVLTLYRHQEVALSYLRLNNSFALLLEQGLGKTLILLTHIRDLLKSGDIQNYLIVAPKSALGAWERDIELFNSEDQILLNNAGTFINYDRVWRKDFDKQTFDLVGLDEAHYIKSRSSRRSKACLLLGSKAKYRYILTGTIISNGKLEDIWTPYTFLDCYYERGYPRSRIFGGAYKKFEDKYCILNMYHKPSSYIHVRELQNIIAEHCYRAKKIDCLDLPDKLPDEIVKVDLSEKKLYKKLATESAILEYEILADNPLSRLIKLRQLCSGFLKLEDGTIIETKNEKLQILEELLESFEDDKKIVIFAEFKYSISKIEELLKKLKIEYVTLDGDQKDKTIWRKFQVDKSIRVFIGQYQSANAGIDLFSSDTIIYYEPTTRSVVLEQSRDRIHRTGQKSKCSYIHLLTKGTVEVDIYRALAGYSDFSEKLFTEYMDGYRRSYNK